MQKIVFHFFLCCLFQALFLNISQSFPPAPEMDLEDVLASRHFSKFSFDHTVDDINHPDIDYNGQRWQAGIDYNGQQWNSYPFRLHDAAANDPHAGAVFQHGQKIIIAFHGSDYFYDWYQNIKLVQKSAVNINLPGMVHTGFSQDIESVNHGLNPASLIDALLQAHQNGVGPFEYIFTGHSRGGALSTLAAGSLTINNNLPEPITEENQVKIITFSSPNVGDFTLVESIENCIKKYNILCFANESDIVPYILPKKGLGYTRVGIWIPIGPIENIYGLTSDYISLFSPRRIRPRDALRYISTLGVGGALALIYQKTAGAISIGSYGVAMHSVPSEMIVRKKFFELETLAKRIEDYEDLQRLVEGEAITNIIKNIL